VGDAFCSVPSGDTPRRDCRGTAAAGALPLLGRDGIRMLLAALQHSLERWSCVSDATMMVMSIVASRFAYASPRDPFARGGLQH
jgi:hypothetical protein